MKLKPVVAAAAAALAFALPAKADPIAIMNQIVGSVGEVLNSESAPVVVTDAQIDELVAYVRSQAPKKNLTEKQAALLSGMMAQALWYQRLYEEEMRQKGQMPAAAGKPAAAGAEPAKNAEPSAAPAAAVTPAAPVAAAAPAAPAPAAQPAAAAAPAAAPAAPANPSK